MAEVDLPLFKLINSSRSTYGLRHQDFNKYQSHCSTRVHHLRKAAGLSQTVSSKNKKYAKKQVEQSNATTDKHLQILLYDAERHWAYSQQLRSLLDNPSTPPSTRQHSLRRLARSVSHAQSLAAITRSSSLPTTVSTQAQAEAYHLLLLGTLYFSKNHHEKGLATLSVAYSLLSKIAETSATAHEEALANEMIDDLEPMLRFCAYSLGRETAQGVSGVVHEAIENGEGQKLVTGWDDLIKALEGQGEGKEKEDVTIEWRGTIFPIRNAQLVEVVHKVKRALKSLQADKMVEDDKEGKGKKEVLGNRRMGVYDKALLTLGEAEDVARQLVEDNKVALSKTHSSRFETSSIPLTQAHSYILYQLLSVRTKRDLLLISTTSIKLQSRLQRILNREAQFVAKTQSKDPKKAATKMSKLKVRVLPGMVKVGEGVVRSLEQMRELESVESDGELAVLVEARIAFARASRCLHLSRTYALLSEFRSSLSLNARGKLYLRESRSALSTLSDNSHDGEQEKEDFSSHLLPLDEDAFASLAADLEKDYEEISRAWFEATGGVLENEADLPPISSLSLEDVQKREKERRPKFYDIAYSYVVAFDMDKIARKAGLKAGEVEEKEMEVDQGDEESEEEQEEQVQPQEQKRGGWGFGLFGRK
ncbi:hypothetical protein T439DRAFT_322324 [Meredithblackwellia eburnea MCA 4105]